MTKLHEALNIQISNWSVLYTKLHRFHWFVKGPQFFTLHEKFEELYDESATVVDEAAETLLAVSGTPVATLKEYMTLTTLEETTGETTATEMVQSLMNDYKQLRDELKELATLSDESGDVSINDFAVGLIVKLDTHIWMLSAYLGE